VRNFKPKGRDAKKPNKRQQAHIDKVHLEIKELDDNCLISKTHEPKTILRKGEK